MCLGMPVSPLFSHTKYLFRAVIPYFVLGDQCVAQALLNREAVPGFTNTKSVDIARGHVFHHLGWRDYNKLDLFIGINAR